MFSPYIVQCEYYLQEYALCLKYISQMSDQRTITGNLRRYRGKGLNTARLSRSVWIVVVSQV